MTPTHVHTPNDGRGVRDVCLNGKQLKQVFFADERKGIVKYYLQPLRLDKHRKRVLSRTERGEVVVVFRENP